MKTSKTPRQVVRTSRATPPAPAATPALPKDLEPLLAAYAEALRGRARAGVALEALAADADKTAAAKAVAEAESAVGAAGAAIDDWVASLGLTKLAAIPAPNSEPGTTGERTKVRVTGPKTGRWRAGQQFFPEPVEITVDDEQLRALEADPRLAVSRL